MGLKRLLNYFLLFVLMMSMIACGGGGGGNAGGGITFSTADLAGTWRLLTRSSTVYGSITLNSAGNVTGGNWTEVGFGSGTYTGGAASLNSQGVLSGSVNTTGGNIHTLLSGNMNINKNLSVLASSSLSKPKESTILVKTGGVYSQADLQGTWFIAAKGMYGTITVSGTGSVTGGSFVFDGIWTKNLTGGTLLIAADGTISGTLTTNEPETYTILSSQMNTDKNLFIITASDTTLISNSAIAIKRSGTFTTSDIAGSYYVQSVDNDMNLVYGSLILNSAGNVAGGNWTEVGFGSGTYTGGTVALNSQGVLSGTVSTSSGNVHTILSGQVDSTNNVGLIVSQDILGNWMLTVFVNKP